jgi:biofilm PGA synthesis protein PgaA
MAETLAPRSFVVENGQGFTALALQEWRQAEALSSDTLSRYPENLQARRLAREWEVHNKAELQVSGYRGLANDSPVLGSGDFGIDTVLYSAPINYNWRVFGGGGYGTGDFEEGTGHYRWLRAGAQWRGRDLTVEGEVSSHNYGYGTKPGLRLSVAYDLNDHWQIGGSGERMSRETPLRALNSDIFANSAELYVRWRAHERREWTLSGSALRFSDGNNRRELNLSGRERLYTTPHFKADGEFLIATQHNTGGSDVPYFNPRSDLMLLPGLRLTHTLHRRYETAWEQIGTVAAGGYHQQGYGTGGVIALGYGQRYRANDVLDMGFMVTGLSRPYDGDRERELRVVFDFTYRF